jgi:hypothetical protein
VAATLPTYLPQQASAAPDIELTEACGPLSETALDVSSRSGRPLVATIRCPLTDSTHDASAAVILLLMSLTLYGSWIFNGVVEMLMGALRPWQLLLGKVGGILTLAIGQLALGVGSVPLAMTVVGTADLPDTDISVGVAALVYLVLGLLLYAFVFAAAGATISRQEDSQTVTMPISLTLVGIYLRSLTVVINDADSAVARIVSISSPLAMAPRIAVSEVPAWEIALSIALLLATMPGGISLAGNRLRGHDSTDRTTDPSPRGLELDARLRLDALILERVLHEAHLRHEVGELHERLWCVATRDHEMQHLGLVLAEPLDHLVRVDPTEDHRVGELIKHDHGVLVGLDQLLRPRPARTRELGRLVQVLARPGPAVARAFDLDTQLARRA